MLPTPLAPLAAWPQFVVWRLEWNQERGKWDKIPYSPRGYKSSSTKPSDWGTYDHAKAALDASAGHYVGIGFVFTAADPFWFLDIDGAYGPAGWSQVAQEICGQLHGAAVEISQSGTGLHLIGSGTPPADHGNRNLPLHLELYSKERFVALTGTNAVGDAATDLTVPLAAVVSKFFNRPTGQRAEEWTTEPCAEWSGPLDDDMLLERAMRSGGQSAASAFGQEDKVTFADLFTADVDVLGAKWPGEGSKPYNASHADQSFANMLAFWTGKDCERIERIMRLSALARPKWDDHATYLQNTILNACGTVGKVYSGRAEVAPPVAVEHVTPPHETAANDFESGVVRYEGGFMRADQQEEYFAGCIWVQNINKVLTPSGELLDQPRFNVVYGGHAFSVTADNSKTSPSAWTAYTENQSHKAVRADRICFRPEMGAGGIVRDAGKNLANTYYPAEHDDLPGDPSKFLDHLKRMFPQGEDFEILVSWMASVLQNPGMKAQWWPVVQGAEGNFKSFLLVIMAHGVGSHYAHLPNMEKMIRGGSNFNGWVERKLFLGLDEVYAANRREFFEGFKTTISNRSIAIEGKGIEEVTGDNRANGMIVTNHQTGVPISGKNRRLAAFFAAQQSPADMIRDGMDAAYISDLKDWLFGEGVHAGLGVNYGIRVVVGHLRTRAIEARLDPARLSIRCPETTSTAAALNAGMGRVEQEVLEAIDEERVGFAGGWVSSTFLDKLLEHVRANIPQNQRRDLMENLGYLYHPALLPSGRATSIVAPDHKKPRLYLRKGHLALNITEPGKVGRAYSDAQDKASGETTAAAFAK